MNERDLFVAALQRADPAECAAFLAEACGNDADLRRRIERLLRLHDGAGSALQEPAVPLNQTFGLIQLTAAKRPLTDWLLTLALAGNRSDAIEPKARGRPG